MEFCGTKLHIAAKFSFYAEVGIMRKLERDVWYEVRTAINVGEPVFQLWWAVVLLYCVLHDAKKRFKFEMRGLTLDDAWLTFYI
ncbi:MAG: hypothetical protein LBH18_05875, partial [Spirochaetaceae bacterium]|nr:hypothetical protein [Spirochaetaceae bacterium]